MKLKAEFEGDMSLPSPSDETKAKAGSVFKKLLVTAAVLGVLLFAFDGYQKVSREAAEKEKCAALLAMPKPADVPCVETGSAMLSCRDQASTPAARWETCRSLYGAR